MGVGGSGCRCTHTCMLVKGEGEGKEGGNVVGWRRREEEEEAND